MDDDETTNVSSLPRSSNSTWYWLKPSLEKSNGNNNITIKQEEESSSVVSSASDDSIQPDEIPSLPSDLVEATKRLATRPATEGGWHWHLNSDGSPVVVCNLVEARRRQQAITASRRDEQGAWHWNLAPDGSFAMSRKRAKRQRKPSRRAPAIVCYGESSDEEDNEEDALEFDGGIVVTTSKGEWRYNHAAWDEKFQRLVKYQKEYETTRVPRSHPILGIWVRTQRSEYKKKILPQYRRERLSSIGFEWSIKTLTPWMEMYKQLLCYKRQHNGSTNVSARSIEYNQLAVWVSNQRKKYAKEKLSQKRIYLLESIGFKWDPLYEQWMEMYQRLVAFNKKYGNTRVPFGYKKDPKLGSWVYIQRVRCKEQYRIDLLNSIGFIWDTSKFRVDRRPRLG